MHIDSDYEHNALTCDTKFIFYITPLIRIGACAFFALLIVLLKRSYHVDQKADC
jgi:hypothetical protein